MGYLVGEDQAVPLFLRQVGRDRLAQGDAAVLDAGQVENQLGHGRNARDQLLASVST